MWSFVLLATVGVLGAFAPAALAAPAPLSCHPSLLEDGSLRMRNMCAMLSILYSLSNDMEAYLDGKPAAAAVAAAMNPEGGIIRSNHQARERREREDGERANSPLMDSGVKRQDVDHVFLRFGRR